MTGPGPEKVDCGLSFSIWTEAQAIPQDTRDMPGFDDRGFRPGRADDAHISNEDWIMPKVTELADYKDFEGWSPTQKAWNYHKPFHRINGPPPPPRPDGHGLDSGCRAPAEAPVFDVVDAITTEAIRTIPNWVPVHPRDDRERELEGILLRSIHSYTDSPFTQWHRWYDWNFHVDPMPDFENLVGVNNQTKLADSAKALGFTQAVIRAWYEDPVDPGKALKRVIECEWDLGGFAGGRSVMSDDGVLNRRAGAMFERDWAWPMTGQYVWLAGRWIYDCGHPQPMPPNPPQPTELMHSELHPCKAVATARWEAIQFPENGDLFVPGIQFMFFASKWGGYHNFATIHDQDYEFIVDLPIPAVPIPVEYPIGHTPDFPLNTLVLRWDLLKKFEFRTFENAVHDPRFPGQLNPIRTVEPKVELVENFNPAKPQVKITIPLKSAPDLANLNSWGVIVSLGWRDADKTQARRVKKCRVRLDEFTVDEVAMKQRAQIPANDNGLATWRARIGVNGRWFAIELNGVRARSKFQLTFPELVFHLSEDDGIHISCSGFIERTQGLFMSKRDLETRTLRFMNPFNPVLIGRVIEYDRHIVGTKGRIGDPVLREVILALQKRGLEVIDFPDKDENFPLGFVDPYVNGGENPLTVDRDLPPTPKIVGAPYSLEAPPGAPLPRQAPGAPVPDRVGEGDLVEVFDKLDYFIKYTVSIERQAV